MAQENPVAVAAGPPIASPVLAKPAGASVNPAPAAQTAGNAVAQKHLSNSERGKLPPNPGSNPRGRPPKNPVPSNLPPQTPGGIPGAVAATAGGPDPAPHPAPLDPGLVRDTLAAILKTVDGMATRKVETTARKLGADDKTTARLVASVKLQPEAAQLMQETLPVILRKHGVQAEHAPEVAFLAGAALYGSGILSVLTSLDALAKEIKAKESPTDAKP